MAGRILLFFASLLLWASQAAAQTHWYRGNTHTHTVNSDGEAAPDAVVRWYKEHGYQFVVLTDHDYRTPVEGLNAVYAAPGRFLVLAGVEVTDRFQGLPVHLNGINVNESVGPQGGGGIVEILNRDARAIRGAGGLPQINHPNYRWALSAEQIAAASEAKHFELSNGHPMVHNRGGGGSPSTEEVWDTVLSTGRVLYALATDDAHYFYGEFSPAKAYPGRGWIVVRAPELTAEAIVAAIEHGEFYASTGVELKSCEADDNGIRLALPEPRGQSDLRYRTYFIGKDGIVLKREDSLTPSYKFQGNELYVRARVEASNGTLAWTQPVFSEKKQP